MTPPGADSADWQRPRAVLSPVLSAAALLASVLAAAAGSAMVWRGWSGRPTLDAAALLGCATLLLLLAAALHRGVVPLARGAAADHPRLARALWLMPLTMLAVSLLALSRREAWLATLVMWLAAAAGGYWLVRRWPVGDRPSASTPPPLAPVAAAARGAVDGAEGDGAPDETAEASGVRQRLVRRCEAGREWVESWHTLALAPWQHQATVHIPYWPPLPADPQVECELEMDGGGDARLEQAEPYGCRIHIRVDEADERPQTIELHVVASAATDPASSDPQ